MTSPHITWLLQLRQPGPNGSGREKTAEINRRAARDRSGCRCRCHGANHKEKVGGQRDRNVDANRQQLQIYKSNHSNNNELSHVGKWWPNDGCQVEGRLFYSAFSMRHISFQPFKQRENSWEMNSDGPRCTSKANERGMQLQSVIKPPKLDLKCAGILHIDPFLSKFTRFF